MARLPMPSNNINLWCQSLGDHIISIKQLDLASFASCCSTSASAIFHARERKIKKPCSRQNWDKWQRNYSCNNFGWAVIKTQSLWRVQEMQVQSLRQRFNLSIRPSDPSIVPWISVVDPQSHRIRRCFWKAKPPSKAEDMLYMIW